MLWDKEAPLYSLILLLTRTVNAVKRFDITVLRSFWTINANILYETIVHCTIFRDVYHSENAIRYVPAIHCFNIRYISSILISSKWRDKQVPVLLTDLSELPFNVRTIAWDSHLVQNDTWSHIGNKWVVFLVKNMRFFSFLAELTCVEGKTVPNRYSTSNDFDYRILGKYWYIRNILIRYTSLALLCFPSW